MQTASGTSGTNLGGLKVERYFTKAGVSPYDEVQWERRTATITDAKGNTIFEQKDVEVPIDWSMTATNIVASKYLHGQMGVPAGATGERRVRALVARVAETIRDWGIAGSYFATPRMRRSSTTSWRTCWCTQKAAFNSPVWFNVGCDRLEPNSDAQNWHWNPHTCAVEFSVTGYRKPQCSACFINAVDDSLDSILTLAKTEGMLFKWGSGTGTNLSLDSRIEGAAVGRRHGFGAAELHARVRCVCRRDQVGRQDAARGQDGDPERGPSGHRGLHRVQDRRKRPRRGR